MYLEAIVTFGDNFKGKLSFKYIVLGKARKKINSRSKFNTTKIRNFKTR